MIGRLRAALREWLLAGLMTCPQCGCLADRRHGSESCGRFLRDTLRTLQEEQRRLGWRVRALDDRPATGQNDPWRA